MAYADNAAGETASSAPRSVNGDSHQISPLRDRSMRARSPATSNTFSSGMPNCDLLLPDDFVVLPQAQPVGAPPQNELLRGHGHPPRLVRRQLQHDEQPRCLRGNAQVLVVLDGQPERKEAGLRIADARRGLQLQVRERAGADPRPEREGQRCRGRAPVLRSGTLRGVARALA